MKRFRFGLHRLERLRGTERRYSEAQLAVAVATAGRRGHRTKQLERSVSDSASRLVGCLGTSTVDSGALRGLAADLETLRHRVRTARSAEHEALADVAERERERNEKSRAHRVVEKLKARRRNRWLEEAEREEQRQLDELHLLRLGRSREESDK